MPFVPAQRFVSLDEMKSEIDRAITHLGPEVVRVRYTIGEDSYGDPAIYFRVILADDAVRPEVFRSNVVKIEDVLRDELQSFPNWGFYPYVHVRTVSEQAQLNDPKWD